MELTTTTTMLFVVVMANAFAVAVLYTPRDRVAQLVLMALPFGLCSVALLMYPVLVPPLLSDPFAHAFLIVSMVILGIFLVRNINHIQV